MKKVLNIVNSWWFKASIYGGAAVALFIASDKLYAGIAIGAGLRELFLAFKQTGSCACACECCKNCDKCNSDQLLKS